MNGNREDLRDGLVDFLRREIVGPDPIPPAVQANGEEILKMDAPRLRYGAGVLFPQAVPVEVQDDDDTADGDLEAVVDGVASTLDPGEITQDRFDSERRASEVSFDLEGGASEVSEAVTATDEAASSANAYLPSALGLSSLVEVSTGGLIVSVTAGQYRKVTVKQIDQRTGQERNKDEYHLASLVHTMTLTAQQLLSPGVVQGRMHVPATPGCPGGLEVHFLSRPRPAAEGSCRLVTISLVNTLTSDGSIKNEECYFQVELKIVGADDGACFVEYPDQDEKSLDEEEQDAALLFRHRKTYAVGHGCAADWTEVNQGRADAIFSRSLPEYEIKPIVPTQFNDLTLSMQEMSDRGDPKAAVQLLTALCEKYEAWIDAQQEEAKGLEQRHNDAAARNIEKCRRCLERMRDGLTLLNDNAQALEAFRLMNGAMLEQQLHYALPLREWKSVPVAGDAAPANRRGRGRDTVANVSQLDPIAWPDYDAPGGKGRWYPFQAAFILMGLRSLTEPDTGQDTAAFDQARETADLIWFPTGGGKTEAYLGLTGYAILLRRLRNQSDGGTTVLMRYTLRLLTAQQFQRAASLICALEKRRRANPAAFGGMPITIGLWVGSLTPNKRADAVSALGEMTRDKSADNSFVLLKCPWCGAQMGCRDGATVRGYEQVTAPRTVRFVCPDAACLFSRDGGIPACVIDEDLYGNPPTLLIGTVDKFAMLTWKPEARSFFGLHDPALSPPVLIIQDELHLISGPLGSMVGHYETVIQHLCTRKIGGRRVRPKVVASTATISRAAEQCEALYGCEKAHVFQFPPQCLRSGDSFFAYEDEIAYGRRYVGVMAPALSSFVTAQVRVMAALLQAALSAIPDPASRDPYWTLMAYFNNLRVLGHAVTLLTADIPEYLSAAWKRQGIVKPTGDDPDLRRFINRHIELTSRESSARVTAALQELERTDSPDAHAVDICLATNMISVGLDVPRLGLMTVVGQPKTTSEYIQATSRVGRQREKPGLVVTLYHPGKPRDRSHYERFRSYHQSIYRQVEPTSVTPFAAPVRDRALHAVLTALIRQTDPLYADSPQPMPSDEVLERIREIIEERVGAVDPAERAETMRLLEERIASWRGYLPLDYGKPGGAPNNPPLLYPSGTEPSPAWRERAWATPTSMRDVDAECVADVLAGAYPRPNGN